MPGAASPPPPLVRVRALFFAPAREQEPEQRAERGMDMYIDVCGCCLYMTTPFAFFGGEGRARVGVYMCGQGFVARRWCAYTLCFCCRGEFFFSPFCSFGFFWVIFFFVVPTVIGA